MCDATVISSKNIHQTRILWQNEVFGISSVARRYKVLRWGGDRRVEEGVRHAGAQVYRVGGDGVTSVRTALPVGEDRYVRRRLGTLICRCG